MKTKSVALIAVVTLISIAAITSGQTAANTPDVMKLLAQGKKAFDDGDFDEAIVNYQKALAIKPNDADANDKFGLALIERGRGDEAIAQFTEATRLDPKNAKVYCNRALTYIDMGDYDKAIMDCLEAIRIDPNRNGSVYTTRVSLCDCPQRIRFQSLFHLQAHAAIPVIDKDYETCTSQISGQYTHSAFDFPAC